VAAGIALAALAFGLIGVGVGASGTSLLALLAKRVAEQRRAAAATVVWLMMIAGFAVTAGVAGHFLDPFSTVRLVTVSSVTAVAAFLLTVVAIWGVEGRAPEAGTPVASSRPPFLVALREVWGEPRARRFTVFVFVSMLAYSAQDLILEPFAGIAFGLTPGQSTQLGGLQHGGVLLGMLLVAGVATGIGGPRLGSLRAWTVGGCIASALALGGLAAAGLNGPPWPLHTSVFLLGAANGAFAVAAIGSMMALAGAGREQREGTRMGLWGAAQAIAFGLGGFLGTVGVDVTRYLIGTPVLAYVTVFLVQAGLFLFAARLMLAVEGAGGATDPRPRTSTAYAASLEE
jgi:BCD family chlorophyll transporter-like MFS transporter